MLNSRATASIGALSGGNNLATALSLNACPYLATSFFHNRPLIQDSIEATTILTQGAEKAARVLGIKGYGRIDFRATESGEYYLIDMQTMPDIHEQSSINFVMRSKLARTEEIYPSLIALNCWHLQLLPSFQ